MENSLRVGAGSRWPLRWRAGALVGLVAVLLCLAALNIVLRASWHEVEDGVRWTAAPEGVVAAEVAAGSAAEKAGVQPGDVLLAIDGNPVGQPWQVVEVLHGAAEGTALSYTLVRFGAERLVELSLQPVPIGHRGLYFVLATVAIFTLLVGLWVRLRRPADQATLHFFWVCVAFFGLFAFSFSGRLDRLDWVFYWADVIAILLLPPLFVHFALAFPERQNAWVRTPAGRGLLPLVYLPAALLGGARVAAILHVSPSAPFMAGLLETVDRLELVYLAVCLTGGLALWTHALRHSRSVTTKRQLRWIIWGTSLGSVPCVFGYALPYALGWSFPSMELLVVPLGLVPLAFASAIVRYRLMDVEVIIKRGLVYTAAISAIAAIYAVLLRAAGLLFLDGSDQHNSVIAMLATLVVVLLARPVKNAIQDTLDRAYYRDRYDYRRALVGFARDLNSDLELYSLSERLVSRIMETLVVDRMALMLAPPEEDEDGRFSVIRAAGFDLSEPPPALARASGIGTRLEAGHVVALDDPRSLHRFAVEEVDFWRNHGIYYFVPCVSKQSLIAVLALGRHDRAEPLNSEDLALLLAVAGQVATALENGRLYRRLTLKAEELHQMREFSDNIVESLNEGLLVADLDERVVRWNRQLEQIYGVSAAAAVGRRLDELLDGDFLQALRAARLESPAGALMYRVPVRTRHVDAARHLLVNVAVLPLRMAEHATAGTILIIEDVTSRVQLEEQLQISEKMASLGLLAAGVAHEVNTPLTGISSYTQMLLERADREHPDRRLLEKIEQQTFRAAKIVNGLLSLARPARLESGPVDVNVVINDVLSLLEHQLKNANIQVRRELAPEPAFVMGVEHKLQQVFLNLFLNARDAMPSGGWLSIRTGMADGEALVEVGDTGSGIQSEHLARIYDPFFTTKPIGKGTGLGLAITYGIVQEHQGTIGCHSVVGQGTRFRLTLPLAAAARPQLDHASPSAG